MEPLEQFLGKCTIATNIKRYLTEKRLFPDGGVWDSKEDDLSRFMEKCGKLGCLSLTVIQTKTQGAWAGITSVDFNHRKNGSYVDPHAVVFTPGRTFQGGKSYVHRFGDFPSWTGDYNLSLGKLNSFLADPVAYAQPDDSAVDADAKVLHVTRIKVFKLTDQPPSLWSKGFKSLCRSAFLTNQFVPIDELDTVAMDHPEVTRPLGVASVLWPEALNVNNPAFTGAKTIVLNCTLKTEEELTGALSTLRFIFHLRPPADGILNRPHTLVLRQPNDELIKALTSSGKVKGIARLVVEKVEDMNAVAKSLENVVLFEEVMLEGAGLSTLSLKEFVQSSQNFRFKQIDSQPSYDQPPEELGKKIKATRKKMEPLLDQQQIGKSSECAMVLRCSSGKVMCMSKEQMNRIGMLKKVLLTVGTVEAAPDAGLMVPTPGEEAMILTKHFLDVVADESTEEDDDEEEEEEEEEEAGYDDGIDPWPLSFESFFAQHLEPRDESHAEIRKCCWLLAEMWGIACYLEIDDLRMFCRSVWVLLTGGGNGAEKTSRMSGVASKRSQ